MRTRVTYPIHDIKHIKEKLLFWSHQFDEVVWLDSNQYPHQDHHFDAVLAVDAFTSIQTDTDNGFEKLKEYQQNINDWIFGYLSYDLKNDTEDLVSNNFDGLEFPELMFFQPKRLFFLKDNELEVHYLRMIDDEMNSDWEAIQQQIIYEEPVVNQEVKVKLRVTKDQYFEKINTLLEHIQRGDIYEANFCQEFYAVDTELNPLQAFRKLNKISKPPFATYVKNFDCHVISASPERYIKKVGNKITSQPIKGTAKRSDIVAEDDQLKKDLASDQKERSENIMIVDLVRNDLSKTALKGSVKVEELCKVYSFKQVHQMISTVTSEVAFNKSPIEVLRTTFPMGSMTGAPKVSAMQIIETLEETKRGVYSGSVGYFTPSNDFDFNVIIRSILYNESNKYVSFSVGGAITAKSKPEKEYEECLIKAKAMRSVLEGDSED